MAATFFLKFKGIPDVEERLKVITMLRDLEAVRDKAEVCHRRLPTKAGSRLSPVLQLLEAGVLLLPRSIERGHHDSNHVCIVLQGEIALLEAATTQSRI